MCDRCFGELRWIGGAINTELVAPLPILPPPKKDFAFWIFLTFLLIWLSACRKVLYECKGGGGG